jgi:hypothetical protein
MRPLFLVVLFALVASAQAGDSRLLPEVEAFIRDRDTCDHFRGEPSEGNTPEQIERREFIFESLEIFCPGTDRRLSALKKRYKNNSDVMKRLNKHEERIEGMTNAP